MDRLKDSQTSLGQIQVSELHKWQYYEGFYMKLGIFGSKVLSVIQSCLFFRSTVYYLTIRCDYSPIFTSPEATNCFSIITLMIIRENKIIDKFPTPKHQKILLPF